MAKNELLLRLTEVTMSPPSYYLVNRTRKEFCYFENEEPIFKVLRESFLKYDWRYTDAIHIESELSDYTRFVEHLSNGLGYIDVGEEY